MFTLHPDVQFTRRNRLHYILDEKDVLMWSGKNITSAIEYLLEQGWNEFRIAGSHPRDCFLVMVHRE